MVQNTAVKTGPATYEQVIAQPIPRATDTFMPVGNKELITMTHKIAKEMGLTLTSPNFSLARFGTRMLATYNIEGQHFSGGDINFKLGILNSCDKSRAARYVFGSEVMACTNGCFYGIAGEDGISGAAGHKHTSLVFDKLFDRLREAMEQFDVFKTKQNHFFNALWNTDIDDAQASKLILDAARFDAINDKDCVGVYDEWLWQASKPSQVVGAKRVWHPEFKDRTAYSLFNAFTEVHKTAQNRNPVQASNRSLNLSRYFEKTLQLN